MKTTRIIRCIPLALAACAALTLHAQTGPAVKDDLFSGTEIFAKNATNVTEITMDPDTLGMVKGRDKDAARVTVLNVVRTYEYDKPGQYRIEDVETFRKKLMTGDWFCAVHTRDMKTGESTDVCTKRRSDDLKETAIITVAPQELTFIHTIKRRSSDGHDDLGIMVLPGGPQVFAALAPMADLVDGEVRAEINANGRHIQRDDTQKSFDKDQKKIKKDLDKQKQKNEKKQTPNDDPTPATESRL